ncbi:MAG: ribosome small subunit-dependent GTPase A [Bacteroidota bacterium]
MARRRKQNAPAGPLLEGVVIRSTGSWYRVRLTDGEVHECKLRGKFRIKGIKTTNPVAVGDQVLISIEEDVGFIREIVNRRNYVLRKSVNLARRAHVLCANIDQAIILFTVADPVTTLGYVDRLLVTCEAYHIPAVVVFNKVDVLDEADQEKLADFVRTYESIGYPVHQVSATDPAYSDEVRDLLKGKVSFLVGRSGAGKSTMVNLVEPELDLKVGEISDFSGRGQHTTTYAEMHELSFGGFIIDSPGFKEMVIFNFEKGELSHYFPEMRPYLNECKFSNCIHKTEPDCAVKAAVEAGELPLSRYHTYLGMLEEIEDPGW